MLLWLLNTVTQHDKMLRDAAEQLQPAHPVDEMIGHEYARLSFSCR